MNPSKNVTPAPPPDPSLAHAAALTVCDTAPDADSASEVMQALGIDLDALRPTPVKPPQPRPRHLQSTKLTRTGLAWQESGSCRDSDPSIFFPDKGGPNVAARRVCAACPILQQCRAYAMADPDLVGVWAGMSAHERAAERSHRAPDAA